MHIIIGEKEFFPGIGEIKFEGQDSDNPLAFKWYDENKMIAGKKLKDHVKFAVAYWHSFCNTGGDPFGPGTKLFPWNVSGDALRAAKDKMDAAFEFITKLGVPYYCFHDIDLVDEGSSAMEYEKRLQTMVDYAKAKTSCKRSKITLGNSQCFFQSAVYEWSRDQSGFCNTRLCRPSN